MKRFLAIEDIETFDIGMIYCKPALVTRRLNFGLFALNWFAANNFCNADYSKKDVKKLRIILVCEKRRFTVSEHSDYAIINKKVYISHFIFFYM